VQHQKPVRVTGIQKDEPNIGLFVLGLIQLARELDEGSDGSDEASWPDTEEEAG
jgi:hypothetical protein